MDEQNIWAGRRQAFVEFCDAEPAWFRVAFVICLAFAIGAFAHGFVWLLQYCGEHSTLEFQNAFRL